MYSPCDGVANLGKKTYLFECAIGINYIKQYYWFSGDSFQQSDFFSCCHKLVEVYYSLVRRGYALDVLHVIYALLGNMVNGECNVLLTIVQKYISTCALMWRTKTKIHWLLTFPKYDVGSTISKWWLPSNFTIIPKSVVTTVYRPTVAIETPADCPDHGV